MIKWIKYDPANPPEQEKDYLILGREQGKDMDFCFVGTFKIKKLFGKHQQLWEDNLVGGLWHGVTHYAYINLPEEEIT